MTDWYPLLVTQTWQLAVVIAVVAMLNRMLCRNRPQLAATLWLIVLAKAVTPPVWTSPVGVFSWSPPMASGDHQVGDDFEPDASVRKAPLIAVNPTTGLSKDAPELGRRAEVGSVHFVEAIDNGGRVAMDVRQWSRIFVGVWLAGVVATFVAISGRLGLLAWKLQRSGHEEHPALKQLVFDLRRRLRVQRSIRLWVTPTQCGPAVIGVVRPCLLMPSALVTANNADELEPIVAHELLHIRRGDLWLGWWQTVVQCLWWFHPLVWWANRCLTRQLERCCDDAVLEELGCDPARYARGLLAALELKHRLQPVPTAPGVRPVDVTAERMERIMRAGQGRRQRTPWWGWALLGGGLLGSLPGATRNLVGDEPALLPNPVSHTSAAILGPPARGLTWTSHDMSAVLDQIAGPYGDRREARQQVLHSVVQSAVQQHQLRLQSGLMEPMPVFRAVSWDGDTLKLEALPEEHAELEQQIQRQLDVGACGREIELDLVMGTHWEQAWGRVNSATPINREAGNGLELLALIESQQRTELLQKLQSDSTSKIMCTPKLRVYDGAEATVLTSTLRPFVTRQSGAPRLVEDGVSWTLQPTRLPDGTIRLHFVARLQAINDVRVLPSNGDQHEVQTPEISSRRHETTIDLPPGQHLVLKLATPGDDLMACISATAVSESEPSTKNQAPFAVVPAPRKEYELSTPVTFRTTGANTDIADALLQRPSVGPDNVQKATTWLPERLRNEYVKNGYKFAFVQVTIQPRQAEGHEEPWEAVFHIAAGPKVVSNNLRSTEPGTDDPAVAIDWKLLVELPPSSSLRETENTIRYWLQQRGYFDADVETSQRGGSNGIGQVVGGRGYSDAGAESSQPDSKASGVQVEQIELRVKTGPRYRISQVVITPDLPTDPRPGSERAGLPIQSGELFDSERIATAAAYIRERFEAAGHSGVEVDSAPAFDARSGKVDLWFTVRSPQVTNGDLSPPRTIDGGPAAQRLVSGTPRRTAEYGRPQPQPTAGDLEQRVTFECQNRPLSEVVNRLAQQTHSSLMLDPNGLDEEGLTPQEEVTFSVVDVPLKDVLQLLADSLNLEAVTRDGVILITSRGRAHPMVVATYPVADLVLPIPKAGRESAPADKVVAQAEPLIQLIHSTVSPDSWNEAGGTGSVKFYEATLSLVVRQSAVVHEELAGLLDQLRRQADKQVVLEVAPRTVNADVWREVNTSGARQVILTNSFGKLEPVTGLKLTCFNAQHLTIPQTSGLSIDLGMLPVV
ncbi:MAG: M56 family metallopeptidase, partial [Planctomycetaceae bacterium]|nr:M56 family metallopeptidase [Planctomycetaceae bacterium]